MTITIFGANGAVGRLLVDRALSEGHRVRAFVHSHNDLPPHPELTIIKGDVRSADDVAAALDGADCVLSALSSWKSPQKDVLQTAMERIIPAMRTAGISRIVSLTGAEARAQGDKLSLVHRVAHAALGIIAGGVLHDGEKHIAALEISGLDWFVLRSPIMADRPAGSFALTTERPMPWERISRQAVVNAMINELTDPHSQQSLFIR